MLRELAQAAQADTSSGGTAEAVLFWVLGPAALGASVLMVVSRKAVHSALWLLLVQFAFAAFYAAQDAPFLAAVQVVVYAGAIMMLFVFVLMLVGVDASDSLVETIRGQRVAAVVAALGFAGLVIGGFGSAVLDMPDTGLAAANEPDNVRAIAELLFRRYVVPFEVTSALLITAALGAMVLTHRQRPTPRSTQREQAIARFAGKHPTPLPGPGVLATDDSSDTPALLPTGAPAPDSISHGPTDGDGGGEETNLGSGAP